MSYTRVSGTTFRFVRLCAVSSTPGSLDPLARLTQLEALFQHSPDAIVVMRPDGTVIDANPAACALHRIEYAHLVGGHLLTVVPTPLHEAVLNALGAMLRGELSVGEAVVLDTDGNEIPVEIRAAAFLYDGGDAVLLQVRDVRARKTAEASARRQELLLRHVVNNTPVFLFAVNEHGEVTLAAGRSLADLRLAPADLLGANYRNVLNRRMAHALRTARDTVRTGVPAVCQIPVDNRTFECWLVPDGSGFIGIATDQTDLIHAKDAAERLGEALRQLAQHEHEALEAERTRIARDVHDVLGQALTAMRIEATHAERLLARNGALNGEVQARLDILATLTDETIGNVRRIATELRPVMLDDLGLGATLAWHAEDFARRTGLVCTFDEAAEDIRLLPEQTNALFRVFQELLTNVVRHAHATRVETRLVVEADAVTLVVADNGHGMDATVPRPHSLGLLGMRERVRPWGGNVCFAHTDGGGTTATVRLPRVGGAVAA